MSDAAKRREELKAVWEQASACHEVPAARLHAPDRGVRRGQRRRRPDVRRRGPGAREDERGLPFVGQAGRLLDKLLERDRPGPRRRVHRERPQVPASRQPRSAAAGDRQLPGLPVPAARPDPSRRWSARLGNFSTKLLRGDPTGITRLHGRDEIRTIGPRTLRLYPIYHPAAALYTPRMLETLREDFARLPELLAWTPRRSRSPSRSPSPSCPSRSWRPSPPSARRSAPSRSRRSARAPEPPEPPDDRQLGLF